MNNKYYNRIILGILLISDSSAGFVAWLIVFKNNYFLNNWEAMPPALFTTLLAFQLCWSTIFFFANLYNTRATLSRFDEIIRLVPIIYLCLILLIVLDVLAVISLQLDYRSILLYGLIFSSFLIINRLFIHTVQKNLLKRDIGLNNAIILGINRRGDAIYSTLKNRSYHGLRVKGFVKAYDDPLNYSLINFSEDLNLGGENDLNSIIINQNIKDVIIALDRPTPERIMSAIISINGSPVSLKILPDMYEVVTGLARTNQLVGVPLIDINFNLDTFYSRILKRFFDIIVASVSLIICLPIWLTTSFFIKVDSRGTIFYSQERAGKDGKLFKIYKFRSMIYNAEKDTGPVWAGEQDKRITRIGKIIRRFHIDETPQLINIIKGDMSLVGPRPERPYFIDKLKDKYPFYSRRFKIRPGVTGWAQINQPFDLKLEDVHQKLKYDFYYIENLSFRLDINIIINTIWVVFRGHKR